MGLGNGRTKAVVGPTINGFGGKENGAVVLSQGGSGHHGKGMMGRRGSTGEPTELGNWQNVECGGGKEKRSPQGFNLYGWESGMNRTPNKGFSVNCFHLEGGNGLNCALTTASQSAL